MVQFLFRLIGYSVQSLSAAFNGNSRQISDFTVLNGKGAGKRQQQTNPVPNMPINPERRDLALECGDMGRHAHAWNLLSQFARFLLKPDEAKSIIDEMEQAVGNRWYEFARREGVSEKDCETIAPAFAYDGGLGG